MGDCGCGKHGSHDLGGINVCDAELKKKKKKKKKKEKRKKEKENKDSLHVSSN
jgi:hypothetical protein